jgi:tRNA-(MS[2]IO[6]A)-hydroxylase (MiaE)-like
VLDWFRRIRKVSQKLTLPSRDASMGRSQVQLNPQKLTPRPEIYLGQLSYLTLRASELLAQDALFAPSKELKSEQAKLAKLYGSRHKELSHLLATVGGSVDLEDQHANRIDDMIRFTQGVGWHESTIRFYLLWGMLEQSAKAVAKGLPTNLRSKVLAQLGPELEQFCFGALSAEMHKRADLSSVLAMYGRSLVADGLLEVRNSVDISKLTIQPGQNEEPAAFAFRAIEPFVSELVAAHSARMDRLGLTA